MGGRDQFENDLRIAYALKTELKIQRDYLYERLKKKFHEHYFDLGEEIGEGAMARVQAAIRRSDGLPVALKIYLGFDLAPYFDAERETLQGIGGHPSIIGMLGSGDFELKYPDVPSLKVMYLVLEKGDSDLRKELEKRCCLPPDETLILARSLAGALHHIHQHGERHLHQDLKPENVIRVNGVWKLADFSIARKDYTLDAFSISYDDPEKGKARKIAPSPQNDLFSFGVVIYEVLAGRRPSVDKIGGRLLPRLPSRRRGLAEQLGKIILACLHPDPRYRYVSADDLKRDLDALPETEPALIPIEPRFGRVVRVVQARIIRILMSIIIMIISLIIGYIHLAEHRRIQDIEREVALIQAQIPEERTKAQQVLGEVSKILVEDRIGIADLSEQQVARVRGDARARRLRELTSQVAILTDKLPRHSDSRAKTGRWLRDAIESSQAMETQYRILGEDLELRSAFMRVRLNRALSLELRRQKRQRDVRFNFVSIANEYDSLFNDRLGIPIPLNEDEIASQARRLVERPGRRQYASFLIDSAFARAESFGDGFTGLININAYLNHVEMLRRLAESIDDQDAWTTRFHRAFAPKGLEIFRLRQIYTKLAEDANPTVVPIAKLTIVAEVLWDHDRDAAIRFLRRVRKTYPSDFWVNHLLADMLEDRSRDRRRQDPRSRPEQDNDLVDELELRLDAYRQFKSAPPQISWLLGDAHFRHNHKYAAQKYFNEACAKDPRLKNITPEFIKMSTQSGD